MKSQILDPDVPAPNLGLDRKMSSADRKILIIISFLGAFPPLSTDLYLPALPGMARSLGVSASQMNLTLSVFFIIFAFSMLFWGPLSDKYGRKPILMTGLGIYLVGSVFCALSNSLFMLVVFRGVQAFGGAAVTTVATAIIKDRFSGRLRETALATIQTLTMIAPILAPILGAFLLRYTSWQGSFWILASMGALGAVLGSLLDETLKQKSSTSFLRTFNRLRVVLKNPGFSSLLLVFSLSAMSIMSFISVSSYIYIEKFGLTEQQYSFYFALNGLGGIIGPFLYMLLSKRIKRHVLITTVFFMTATSGALTCIFGSFSPILFALTLMLVTISGSALRPPSANILLEQQKEDTGSASSLMVCTGMTMGSIGMTLISMNWENTIVALGILISAVSLISGIGWLYFSKKPFVVQIPDSF